ncbi:MAG: hypothetical protein LBE22_04605 [Azoarcus sp.]|jgi:hypothetical protein|nr:hypothetical protein [Azoarcus sp.]
MKTAQLVKFATRMALSIPVLPAVGGLFKNRRSHASKVCAPADIAFNVSDWFHSFINRSPGGGQTALVRDKDGHACGSINRLP